MKGKYSITLIGGGVWNYRVTFMDEPTRITKKRASNKNMYSNIFQISGLCNKNKNKNKKQSPILRGF